MDLDLISQRVLGALMEKEMTTPELYPLSLNALLAACNQKSSRDPVLQLTEDEIRVALAFLEEQTLTGSVREARVLRFEHRIRTVLQLRRDETALLCLLLLRGAQTAGELRSRADRLFLFEDLGQLQSCLERLANRPVPLTRMLPRDPGSREVRWIHLLRKASQREPENEASMALSEQSSLPARIEDLERRVLELERLLANSSNSRSDG